MTDDEIFEECRHLSIMGNKLPALIRAARQCVDVPGVVVEVGSYRGGSGLALCRVFNEKKVFMMDTFSGIPSDDVHDGGHKQGDFGDTSLQGVLDMLGEKGVNNALVLQGDIRDERLTDFLHARNIAFAHIDADIEQSTTAAIRFLLPRLTPGGGLFFDDYGSQRCPSVKPAVDALLQSGKFSLHNELGTAFLKS